MRIRRALACLLSLAILAPAAVLAQDAVPEGAVLQADARPALGLMGTIPIYWGEPESLEALLSTEHRAHWARARIERGHDLVPIDYLTPESLAPVRRLLLAQPRGLAPEENVALDDWVRGGGHLLLFVDPMMTGESRFAIGDRRRPQDVALLSPILAHWGLDLRFDGEAVEGLEMREIAGRQVPVNLPGHFGSTAQGGDCSLESAGLLAVCSVGAGRAVILADGALMDLAGPWPNAQDSLDMLLERAFPN